MEELIKKINGKYPYEFLEGHLLIQGDCLEIMNILAEANIIFDATITDIPYGTTACKWDKIIPFESMWERLNKLIKSNGVIALFGSEPFSSYLRLSNIKNYKYDWIWDKDKGFGIFLAKKRPLKTTENICIFYKKQPIYNPQMTNAKPDRIKPTSKSNIEGSKNNITNSNNCKADKNYDYTKRYPLNLLTYSNPSGRTIHPTQKPVSLIQYLIKTYTNKNELVLDFTAGSFTTTIACIRTNRKSICIEKDEDCYRMGVNRVKEELKQGRLF